MSFMQNITPLAISISLLAFGTTTPAVSGTTLSPRELTAQECSACHMAFPAAFLPQRSWRKIMSTLDNHFGEDASLDAKDAQDIQKWLTANAADTSSRSSWVLRGVAANDTPLRITELPWWKRQHNKWEVSARAFKKAGSKSNCLACHRAAQSGNYDDD